MKTLGSLALISSMLLAEQVALSAVLPGNDAQCERAGHPEARGESLRSIPTAEEECPSGRRPFRKAFLNLIDKEKRQWCLLPARERSCPPKGKPPATAGTWAKLANSHTPAYEKSLLELQERRWAEVRSAVCACSFEALLQTKAREWREVKCYMRQASRKDPIKIGKALDSADRVIKEFDKGKEDWQNYARRLEDEQEADHMFKMMMHAAHAFESMSERLDKEFARRVERGEVELP